MAVRGQLNRHSSRIATPPHRCLVAGLKLDLEWEFEDGFHWEWPDEHGEWAPEPDAQALLAVFREAIRAERARPTLALRLPRLALRAERRPGPTVEPPAQGEAGALAEALHRHTLLLANWDGHLRFAQRPDWLAALRRVNGGAEGLEETLARFQAAPGLLAMVLLLVPFWLRPLWAWTPPEGSGLRAQAASLVEHLFVRYPAPAYLSRCWLSEELPELKWACWLVLLGQGASLPREAPRFGWSVARGLVEQLFLAHPDALPAQACLAAEVHRLGGSDVEVWRLLRHPAFSCDPTQGEPQPDWARAEEHPAFLAFWRETVAWLTRHREALAEADFLQLLEWGLHEFTEAQGAGRLPFSWKGRSPRSAAEAAVRYQRQLRLPHLEKRWAGRGWDAELPGADGASWRFRELTSGLELHQEGQALRHCVATYAGRCVEGRCAIFSLTRDGLRRLTLELAPGSLQVLQARGERNRPASPEEEAVVARWLAALRLTG